MRDERHVSLGGGIAGRKGHNKGRRRRGHVVGIGPMQRRIHRKHVWTAHIVDPSHRNFLTSLSEQLCKAKRAHFELTSNCFTSNVAPKSKNQSRTKRQTRPSNIICTWRASGEAFDAVWGSCTSLVAPNRRRWKAHRQNLLQKRRHPHGVVVGSNCCVRHEHGWSRDVGHKLWNRRSVEQLHTCVDRRHKALCKARGNDSKKDNHLRGWERVKKQKQNESPQQEKPKAQTSFQSSKTNAHQSKHGKPLWKLHAPIK